MQQTVSLRAAGVVPRAASRSARNAVPLAATRSPVMRSFRPQLTAHRAARRCLVTRAVASPAAPSPAAPGTSTPVDDPWEDAKWSKTMWTVYRGTAYDLGPFMAEHPGGNWLLRLAIHRDATALVESYHLRSEVAEARFKRLPKLPDFPVSAVPQSPRPNDSELYNAIRNRVRTELFPGAHGQHRGGGNYAIACILGSAALAYALYCAIPGALTGALLGLTGAWIGLTVQHCANHGAMSTSAAVNGLLGLTDDLIGGSSLMWRYHHQVSHHIHCNDTAFDEDVFSGFPLLRFDSRLPRQWFHKYQHIYMWALFPAMLLAFHVGDIKGMLQRETAGTKLRGASTFELATVALGKAAHFALMLAPAAWAGWQTVLCGLAAFIVTQGVVLSATFAVSHNVDEAKVQEETGGDAATRDWGRQQVLTSADWGGVVGNFFTGGLNLQVEHHLFPAICFVHYPAIAAIVKDECAKRNVPYASYDTLPQILVRFVAFMAKAGAAEQVPTVRFDLGPTLDAGQTPRFAPMPGQAGGCPLAGPAAAR